MLLPEVRVVCCAPKTHPCPHCGHPGRRVRRLCRKVRALAYRREAWLEVRYAEYKARCRCRKTFRSWPLGVPAKADYDELVRQAALDRVLEDGMNVQRTLAAMWRDFYLKLSEGFVYDCIRWAVARLALPAHRRMVSERASGTLCIYELHLGRFTLLLATDPIADIPVAFALAGRNDKLHMRRFLKNLKGWGLLPRLVVTDGSDLYPAVLAELWPAARHQLCVFHILKDVNDLTLGGVRRLARALPRPGNAGRKRKAGPARPNRWPGPRPARRSGKRRPSSSSTVSSSSRTPAAWTSSSGKTWPRCSSTSPS